MSVLFWIVDGLVAGWLTGKIMSSEGRDRIMDLVMGVAGAVAVGFLFSVTPFLVQGKMIYTNLAAFLGAIILRIVSRYFNGKPEYVLTD
jgi:uncharacterized membrane protein YeaQ/YmgE (transglycosylase-associated protein family)